MRGVCGNRGVNKGEVRRRRGGEEERERERTGKVSVFERQIIMRRIYALSFAHTHHTYYARYQHTHTP